MTSEECKNLPMITGGFLFVINSSMDSLESLSKLVLQGYFHLTLAKFDRLHANSKWNTRLLTNGIQN